MDIYKTLDAIKNSNLKARRNNDFNTLLVNGQALLDWLPNLIDYNVEQEHEYRKFEAEQLSGENITSSKAEALAKATVFYKEFIRSKNYISWIYECVNMSKKLASDINNNLKAS